MGKNSGNKKNRVVQNKNNLESKLLLVSFLVFLQSCGGSGNRNSGGGGEMTPPPPPSISTSVQAAVNDAFVYGYPLNEMMRICDRFPAVNRLNFRSALATPQNTNVIRPNNDTLYTSACAYLGTDWVIVSLPASPDRYQSMQVFNAYTETAAVRGPNEVPSSGAEYVLRYSGANNTDLPVGVPVIDVSTPFAFLLIRTLVDGPADLAAADAVQRSIELMPNSLIVPDRTAPSSVSPAQDFFLKLMLRLAQNPPPVLEQNQVESFALAGVRASLSPSLMDVTKEQLAAWEIAYTEGLSNLNGSQTGTTLGSWRIANPNAATPGTDYELRAAVARHGIFPAPPTEAIYARANGDGLVDYVLDLPATWPPVNPRGFWSLTMYNNSGFLVENDIDRYSIGDRTPGIIFDANGSLKIYIQCTDPGGQPTANWLPAPCGPFTMNMRLYLPNAVAQDPSFMFPIVM